MGVARVLAPKRGDAVDDIENHPDLTDAKWLRGAERRARRAARRSRPRKPGPRLSRLVIPTVLVAFAGALFLLYRVGSVPLPDAAPTTAPAPPPTSARPDPTTIESTGHVDLTHPFADTPAANWATTIPVPAATAVGGFTAAQVTAAYQAVQRTSTESRLDPQVTVHHDTAPFIATLATGVKLPDANGWVTKIADGYQLLPVPPRVDGSMTSSVDDRGRLVVHTNFVYVYAFQPASHEAPGTPWDIVSVVHENADYTMVDGKPWPSNSKAYFYSMNCDLARQDQLAPQYSGSGAGGTSTEKPEAYFDPKHPIDVGQGC
ncbi:hypothetical protein BCF44_110239 [Kutzneria buriramensis]|uniref:Uncharacterized protein n=1 Tax=Kutzneria buriramensis TaxID=1045776 RepID=A0A3E0HDL4_9PSEU|nr:hypothetical protein BCF44_110239 [Kutzneria buriramensis]